ncbi:winged helix-turn-helix domain-containing protein [Aeromonas hydrophila]|uniref:winged helix-turn-helix domain-containing protein n=1 Tax=Aeromonas hydrophila TaxID=644 RepID=UPI001F60B46C|nr:winged helix-turn-helix domain-containing protein [Aeromonas hydrophila]UNU27994.1 winged helix family transcriptional regulator [Aeromonas hydrophila]
MTKQYQHNDVFTFEPETFRIILEKKEIKLSHKEAAVLVILCDNAMKVVERKDLLKLIWNDRDSSDISLNKNILLLRRKFESIGINKAIDTIPRVGYMLRLDIDTVQGATMSNRDVVITDNEEDINENDYNEEQLRYDAGVNKYKRLTIFGLVIAVISFFSFIYIITRPHTEAIISDLPATLGNMKKVDSLKSGRTLLYTDEITPPQDYTDFDKKISKSKSYYALLSKETFSYIDIDLEKNIIWQKTFFIDWNGKISNQLDCIANYINSYKATPRNVDDVPGMIFVRLKFYRTCNNETRPDYIGEVLIKSTLLSRGNSLSTWTQDFSFISNNEKTLFHFKRVSRANIVESEPKYYHLSIKSINVDSIEQDLIQRDYYVNYIFNQFTQDDIYHIYINRDLNISATSPFGGILFHGKTFSEPPKT